MDILPFCRQPIFDSPTKRQSQSNMDHQHMMSLTYHDRKGIVLGFNLAKHQIKDCRYPPREDVLREHSNI
eukprot:6348362-Amphidinium_carterae.2